MIIRTLTCILAISSIIPACNPRIHVTGQFKLENNTNAGALEVIGPVSVKKVAADSVNVTGPLTFNALTVHGATIIIGPFTGTTASLAQLTVTGSLNVTDVSVAGATYVCGACTFKDSTLHAVTLATREATFENTPTDSIFVKKEQTAEPQIIILNGEKSIVQGDVTFEGKNGKVILTNNAKITGNVIDGQITQE